MAKNDATKKMLENRKNRKEFKIQKGQGNARKCKSTFTQSLKTILTSPQIYLSSRAA